MYTKLKQLALQYLEVSPSPSQLFRTYRGKGNILPLQYQFRSRLNRQIYLLDKVQVTLAKILTKHEMYLISPCYIQV